MKWFSIQAKTNNKSADVMIYDRIGKDFWGDGSTVEAKRLINELKALGELETINVFINSPGGSVFDGNAIYNYLKSHKAEINVKVDGIAASIASVIAMSGDEIEMPENAMIMIHDPAGLVAGTAEDMNKMAVALEKIKTGMIAVYHNRSRLENDQISEMMTDETWLTAAEAVKYGLADKVTEKVSIQAGLKGLEQYKNVPKNLIAGISGQKNVKEDFKMPDNKLIVLPKAPEITLELIKAEYPDIVTDLTSEGKQAGLREGAANELARIKAVSEQLIPGHEDLITALMWDGKTTGEQAAVQVLGAEKVLRTTALANHRSDAPDSVHHTAIDAPAAVDDNLSVEEKCKKAWAESAEIRAEFMDDFETYVAAEKAIAAGLVKTISKK